MSGWYLHHLLFATIVAVTALAWFKGAWPERFGASLNLLFASLFFVLQLVMQPTALATSILIMDGLLGLGFLVLALRYTSLWLGAAMLLQAGQFSLHAFYYVTTKPVDRLFAIVNNVVSWGILLSILTGVGASWLNSRKASQAAAR
jgi:hypothetical protein